MKFWTLEILGFIWSLPVTVLGVLLIVASGGYATIARSKGLRFWFILRYPWWWRKRFNAMNMGAVFFFRFGGLPGSTIIDHEEEHRRQCWILGPFSIPLYLLFCLLALTLYRKYYRANWLEIMARWKAGQGLEP